jgi:triacylglycerol lipase
MYRPYIKRYAYVSDVFDPKLSLLLLALINQVYNLYEGRGLILPTYPEAFRLVKVFDAIVDDGAKIFGVIVESNTKIIIAFRGTHTFLDFLRDIEAIRTPYELVPGGGKVHKGFYTIYTKTRGNQISARDSILSSLTTLNPSKKLYVTGSSLGGALATLSALDIAVNSPFKQPIIYTNGSPRVGNETFVSLFNRTIDSSIRLVNKYDMIPKVPPEILGYRHVKGAVPIEIQTGNPVTNHYLTTAYFPGVVNLDPIYAREFCTKNPVGYCPPTANISCCVPWSFNQDRRVLNYMQFPPNLYNSFKGCI